MHIAAHLDMIEQRIQPALDDGRWVVLDRFWWSTWVYGRASTVEQKTLDAMIQLERLQWNDTKPAVVFLIDRSTDSHYDQGRRELCEGYQILSDKEQSQHPVRPIQNDGSVDKSLSRY